MTQAYPLRFEERPKEACADGGIERFLPKYYRSVFVDGYKVQEALSAEWSQQLATSRCIVADKALDHYDLVLRRIFWTNAGSSSKRSPWSIPSPEARGYLEEIRDGDKKTLYRHFAATVTALFAPLALAPPSLERSGFRDWGWATTNFPGKPVINFDEIDPGLYAQLAVRRRAEFLERPGELREKVRAMLPQLQVDNADVATPLIRQYVIMLEKSPPAAVEDIELIGELIADPRLTDLPGAYVLPRVLSSMQLAQLLPGIVHKLKSVPPTVSPLDGAIGEALDSWPEGAFAAPDADTLALVRDPIQRRRATGLIKRLADMGSSAAPLLADMIAYHVEAAARFSPDDPQLTPQEKSFGRTANERTAVAAMHSMCILGRQAASELPRMKSLEAAFRSVRTDYSGWDVMMARIGGTVTARSKYASMSQPELESALGTSASASSVIARLCDFRFQR